MSHPYLALYNEGVLLILWTSPRCLVVCSLIQLNLWLLRNSVYFAWRNTTTLYLSVCLPVCLSVSVIISLCETLIFHLSFPLPCAPHASSSCWVSQPACLWFSIFYLVSVFDSIQFWIWLWPTWKEDLNVWMEDREGYWCFLRWVEISRSGWKIRC